LEGRSRLILTALYIILFSICFIFYQHEYWIHYPWNSERWWHYGFKEAFAEVKKVEGDYEKIIISTANEPPWVFFAGLYQYPPDKWQENYPLNNKINLPGFGRVSFIDKFYFASPQDLGFYEWGKLLDKKTLYVASATEVNVNLIKEPERIAPGLTLLKAIAYPSGEPAFYVFSGQL